MEKRCNFELFKSNVCHRLKESGDIDFLIETLEKDMIREYYNRKWYLECFYLLAMVDYISREIGAPLCSEYDDLRQQRLQKLVYPAGVIVTANVLKNDQIKEEKEYAGFATACTANAAERNTVDKLPGTN